MDMIRQRTIERILGITVGVSLVACSGITLGVGLVMLSHGRITW